MNESKLLCLERDARRCRHCSATEDIDVFKLTPREGRLSWHLSNLITLCQRCKDSAERTKQNTDNLFGVILCGGKGTRLFPETKFLNKHVLPIGLIPMVMYPIKTLQKFGVRRVLVILDRENAGTTIEILGSGKEFGMEISFRVQEGAGGIGEALYLAKDFVKPDDKIVCILGDNIFDLINLDTGSDLGINNARVYIKEVQNPKDYGVAEIKDDKVVDIVEKPSQPKTNFAVVGLYIYTNNVFNVIETIKPSNRGELEISDVNAYYAHNGVLEFREVKGYWADCGGSIQRYCEASLHGAREANVTKSEINDFISVIFDDK